MSLNERRGLELRMPSDRAVGDSDWAWLGVNMGLGGESLPPWAACVADHNRSLWHRKLTL